MIYKAVMGAENRRELDRLAPARKEQVRTISRKMADVEAAVIDICHESGMSTHYEMICDIDASHEDFVHGLLSANGEERNSTGAYRSLRGSIARLTRRANSVKFVDFDADGTPNRHRLNTADLRHSLNGLDRLGHLSSNAAKLRIARRLDYLNAFLKRQMHP